MLYDLIYRTVHELDIISYTRQRQSLRTAVVRNQAIYKTFTFHMTLEFGIAYQQKLN